MVMVLFTFSSVIFSKEAMKQKARNANFTSFWLRDKSDFEL